MRDLRGTNADAGRTPARANAPNAYRVIRRDTTNHGHSNNAGYSRENAMRVSDNSSPHDHRNYIA
jgi:hypothetical protein